MLNKEEKKDGSSNFIVVRDIMKGGKYEKKKFC